MTTPLLQTHHVSGRCPVHLINSTIVPCPGTDLVFLFGGFDHSDNLDSKVYLLNTADMRWEVDSSHPGIFRDGHAAVYIGNYNILVFGGVPYEEVSHDEALGRSNDDLMVVYSIKDRKWISPPEFTLDNAPSSRSRHACCISPDGSKVYISGGLVNSSALGDLYVYDLRAGTWAGPYNFVGRFGHTITVYKNRIFSFGGLNKDMNHVTDTVAFFDLEDHSVGEIKLLATPQNKLYDASLSHNNFERLYLDLPASSLKLNVCIPSMIRGLVTDPWFCASYYDLDRLKCVHLADFRALSESLFDADAAIGVDDHDWMYAVVTDNNSLMFLGTASPSDPDTVMISHEMNYVLEIQLDGLGLPDDKDPMQIQKRLSSDFARLFHESAFTDFEIVCFKKTETKDAYNDDPDLLKVLAHTMEEPAQPNELLETIRVHKAVLIARWPHFKRLIESGMNESVENRMFIPEPSSWVRALLLYLYTGSLEGESSTSGQHLDLVDYCGLLVMSNFYDLAELRSSTISIIHERLNSLSENEYSYLDSELAISGMLKAWTNLVAANEQILIDQASDILRNNWHLVLASEAFGNLDKAVLVHLCQVCTSTSNSSPRRAHRKRKSRMDMAFGSHESLSTLESLRSTPSKSPFIQPGLRLNDSITQDEFDSKLPALQHLSSLLGNTLHDI